MTEAAREPGPGRLVPDWLVQATGLGWRVLVVVALGVVVLWVAAILGTVIASVILAAAVTAAFDPLAERLRASGRSRAAVSGIVSLTAIGLAIVVLAVVAVAFVPATADLLKNLEAGLAELEKAVESGSIPPPASTLVTELVNGVTDWVSVAAAAVVAGVASMATVLLLAAFLLFFFVPDANRAVDWTLQAAAPWQRTMIAGGAATARRRLGRSLRETALQATVLGTIALGVGLVLGLPAPLALAVLVFGGGFVPLVGPIATIAVVGLVALGTGGLAAAIAALAVLAATPILLRRVLGPDRWRGHGVHPAVVLVALTIGAVVAGPLGLILGVPVVIAVREIAPHIIAALNESPGPERAATIVPRWLDRIAQWSWRLLVLAAVAALGIAGLAQVPLIVIPLVAAAVVAATLAPGLGALQRRGAAPTTASLVLTVGGFGIVLAILVVTLAALAGQGDDIVANASGAADRIDELLNSGASMATIVAAVAPEIVRAIAVVVAALAGVTLCLVLAAILTFYLLRDGRRGFDALAGPLARWRRDELREAAGRATGILGGYMIATGAISAVGAASQFLVMWLLGIPLAWPLAILTFFGGFIPYIGSLLTTGLAFLVTVAVGTPQDVAIMAIFTLVFNIVQGNIVAPLFYSRAVSIHPAVVLLAIPVGSALAGIAGMFLAVPLIGVFAATWRTVLHVFGTDPADRLDRVATEGDRQVAAGPGATPH